MTAAAICFHQVCKRFDNQSVLRGVDLEVHAGECFALVGINGAGKTTCIKTLLDFIEPDSGRITLFGTDHRQPAAREPLVFLPERFLPPFHLTGREFLRYMSRLHGQPLDPSAVQEVAASLDLESHALERPARAYSKGMAQKLGLVACLLSAKQLLVLDEPMTGLDPKARLLAKREIVALRDSGRTLFFSTHVLSDVESLCDRLAILHDGTIRFVGSPSECRRSFGAEQLEEAYLACIST